MHNYYRFFEAHMPPFLLESIYVNAYRDLDCIAVKRGDDVCILFCCGNMQKCAERGRNLLESDQEFSKYHEEFSTLLDSADALCESAIEQVDGEKLVKFFLDFLGFYRWTESFYTETAYCTAGNGCSLIRSRLNLLEQIKTRGRYFLNRFFNGERGYLNRMAEAYGSPQSFLYGSIENGQLCLDCSEHTLNRQNHLLTHAELLDAEHAHFFRVCQWLDHFQQNQRKLVGTASSKGKIKGSAFVLSSDFSNYDQLEELIDAMPEGAVLVSETTSPDLILACAKAAAIVTNQGGLGSHAAIISRELGIPCVIGTFVATKVIQTGDQVEVNGDNGMVIIT